MHLGSRVSSSKQSAILHFSPLSGFIVSTSGRKITHDGDKEFLVNQVLDYVDTNDLFNCSEVNAVWNRASIRLLRKKLKYVSCFSLQNDEDSDNSYLQDFCLKLRRYRNIARNAGQTPSLNFLLYGSDCSDERYDPDLGLSQQNGQRVSHKSHAAPLMTALPLTSADVSVDYSPWKRTAECGEVRQLQLPALSEKGEQPVHSLHKNGEAAALKVQGMIQCVRQILPVDCITIFFKSKTIKLDHPSKRYAGLSGALLFEVLEETGNSAARSKRDKSMFRRSEITSLGRVSKFLRRWVLGERGPSAVSCFKNTGPGVMSFQSRLNVPLDDAERMTTYYVEQLTGHKLQVTTTALLARMRRRSLESILSLRDTFKSVENTMIVVFQNDPVDTFVLQHIKCVFDDMPVISLSGEMVGDMRSIASNGTTSPPDRRRVLVMLLRLLPRVPRTNPG
ncbi:hypothetical protein HPB47_020892 [Ixodes persulcatus]|uniref:Uncharacterized protein n=1 Tax=Ixodes persulcatus TaxID=34615 RepID=A0AC60QGL3_IXOPE|nr:hypothetical protein HPB47_020892 [Ixodes persulcatus]